MPPQQGKDCEGDIPREDGSSEARNTTTRATSEGRKCLPLETADSLKPEGSGRGCSIMTGPFLSLEDGRQLQPRVLVAAQKPEGVRTLASSTCSCTASRRRSSAVGGPQESIELGFKSTLPTH